MSILKFAEDAALDAHDYKGEPNDQDDLKLMVTIVNEKIATGTVDSWGPETLGYCGYFADRDSDDEPLIKRISAEERSWIYESVMDLALDTRQAGWDALAELGAVKAEVEFSGGHDEGGVDGIRVTLGDGSTMNMEDWPRTDTNPHWRVAELLALPVYSKYHTFAGEFSVHGEVTWDVAEKTVKMNGSETVEEWHSIDGEV